MYEELESERFKSLGIIVDVNSKGRMERYLRKFENVENKIKKEFWKNRRTLIIGISGYVGSSLAKKLTSLDADIYGIDKEISNTIQKLIDEGKVEFFGIDDLEKAIEISSPEVIFFEGFDVNSPKEIFENCNLLTNALKSSKKLINDCLKKFCISSSSDVYGFVMGSYEIPIRADMNELRPISLNGFKDVIDENIGKSFFYLNYNSNNYFPISIIRYFNEESVIDVENGPINNSIFSQIAKQVAEILSGKRDEIEIINGSTIRDLCHIRDTVDARLLAGEGYFFDGIVANVCSRNGISVEDFAKLALKEYNLDDVKIIKKEKKKYFLGFDCLIGHPFNFQWKPTKSVIDIIKDSVEYWRGKI